jgi:hypothetical protein
LARDGEPGFSGTFSGKKCQNGGAWYFLETIGIQKISGKWRRLVFIKI